MKTKEWFLSKKIEMDNYVKVISKDIQIKKQLKQFNFKTLRRKKIIRKNSDEKSNYNIITFKI